MPLIKHLLLLLPLLLLITHGRKLKGPDPWVHWASYRRWLVDKKPCPFVDDPRSAVERVLRAKFVAQDEAVSDIVSAVGEWHDDHLAGADRPLVIALTGPTGVGKSETANLIATALLGGSAQQQLEDLDGLVRFDGTEFHAGASVASSARVIRDAVAQGLYQCFGQIVVILDEVQRVDGGALESLSPLLQPMHPTLVYHEHDATASSSRRGSTSHESSSHEDDGTSEYDTRDDDEVVGADDENDYDGRVLALTGARAVYILVADVGKDRVEEFMEELLALKQQHQQQHGDASFLTTVISARMRAAIRNDLSKHWHAAGTKLGDLMNVIVPFMPYNQSGLRAILRDQLLKWALRPRPGLDWLAFVDVDSVAEYLTDPSRFAAYHVSDARRARIQASFEARAHRAQAEVGALGDVRDEVSEGSGGGLHASLPFPLDEEGGGGAAGAPAYSIERNILCGDSGAVRGSCACVVPPDIVSGSGARGLLFHAEGPLERFKRTMGALLPLFCYGYAAAAAAAGATGSKHVITVGTCDDRGVLHLNDGHALGRAAAHTAANAWGATATHMTSDLLQQGRRLWHRFESSMGAHVGTHGGTTSRATAHTAAAGSGDRDAAVCDDAPLVNASFLEVSVDCLGGPESASLVVLHCLRIAISHDLVHANGSRASHSRLTIAGTGMPLSCGAPVCSAGTSVTTKWSQRCSEVFRGPLLQ